jgi:hypothetical protein
MVDDSQWPAHDGRSRDIDFTVNPCGLLKHRDPQLTRHSLFNRKYHRHAGSSQRDTFSSLPSLTDVAVIARTVP